MPNSVYYYTYVCLTFTLLAITGNIDNNEAKRSKTQKMMDQADSAILLLEADAEGIDETFNM